MPIILQVRANTCEIPLQAVVCCVYKSAYHDRWWCMPWIAVVVVSWWDCILCQERHISICCLLNIEYDKPVLWEIFKGTRDESIGATVSCIVVVVVVAHATACCRVMQRHVIDSRFVKLKERERINEKHRNGETERIKEKGTKSRLIFYYLYWGKWDNG